MPDITMCEGRGCPMKNKCYRFTAKPSDYQSFFMHEPVTAAGTCDYFWEAAVRLVPQPMKKPTRRPKPKARKGPVRRSSGS